MKKLNISILGCGWLGLPLLKALVADGHTVKGSSRNPETLAAIKRAGAAAFRIDLPQVVPPGFSKDCEVLIITLPPGGRKFGAEAARRYTACLGALSEWLRSADAPAVIFTSSIGVYGNHHSGVITERNRPYPDTHSGHAVLEAEALLESSRTPLTILRLAGLVAADRHPGRFFGGNGRPVPATNAPVNLVHRLDVIAAVRLLLGNTEPCEIYNVCANAHPTKGDFYVRAAGALGLEVVGTEPGGADGKIINSDKLRARGWKPRWDDLDLDFLKKTE